MNPTLQAFGYPDTLIKEYDHWVALLRPTQVTAGSLVLAEKSDAKHLGEVSGEVWSEFATVSEEMEKLVRTAFGAEKFNYLALMMKDPNVHFHFIPRYSQGVEVGEQTLVDADWPKKTEMKPIEISDEVLAEIKQKLLANA